MKNRVICQKLITFMAEAKQETKNSLIDPILNKSTIKYLYEASGEM